MYVLHQQNIFKLSTYFFLCSQFLCTICAAMDPSQGSRKEQIKWYVSCSIVTRQPPSKTQVSWLNFSSVTWWGRQTYSTIFTIHWYDTVTRACIFSPLRHPTVRFSPKDVTWYLWLSASRQFKWNSIFDISQLFILCVENSSSVLNINILWWSELKFFSSRENASLLTTWSWRN